MGTFFWKMAKRLKIEATGLNLPNIPLDALLSFLKDTRGALNWSDRDLRACLKLDARQAAQLLAILEMQGYVSKEGGQWLTTAAGESISKSKKPQFSQVSVASALDILKDRIEALNRDKRNEFKIAKAVAYGDFLVGRSRVQAADVGVELLRRDPLSGTSEETDEKRRAFMKDLRRTSRLFSVLTYRSWMSQRSHRNLL